MCRVLRIMDEPVTLNTVIVTGCKCIYVMRYCWDSYELKFFGISVKTSFIYVRCHQLLSNSFIGYISCRFVTSFQFHSQEKKKKEILHK